MTVHLGKQVGSTSVRALTTALALRKERGRTSPDLSYNTVFISAPQFNLPQIAVFIESRADFS